MTEGQQLGEFQIIGLLGQGETGAVYKALHTPSGRVIALRIPVPAIASDADRLAMILHDASVAAVIRNPLFVQVHSFGESGGVHYVETEFVGDESAEGRLKRKGRIGPANAIAIGTHVSNALDYAWKKADLIHRDIRPGNIFISREGGVRLGALGLATRFDKTRAPLAAGSPPAKAHYMSPEQAEGREDIDLRANIYGLGCVLFHLLSGRVPYEGDDGPAVAMNHANAPVPNVRSVWAACPPALATVIARMMQKAPSERYQTYDELDEALRDAHEKLDEAPAPPQSPAATAPGVATASASSPAPAASQPPRAAAQRPPASFQPRPAPAQPQPDSAQPPPATTQLRPVPAQPSPASVQPQAVPAQPQPLPTQAPPTTTQLRPVPAQKPPATTRLRPVPAQPPPGSTMQLRPAPLQPYQPPPQTQPAPTRPAPAAPSAAKSRKAIWWWAIGGVAAILAIVAIVYFATRKGTAKNGGDESTRPLESKPGLPKATTGKPFTNTLGMKFVPVRGTDVLVSIWETRVQDYSAFATAVKADDAWTIQNYAETPVSREPAHPVCGVSWDDAKGFCQWLTEKETAEGVLKDGARYRLPTDTEWSHAVGLHKEEGETPRERSGKNTADYPWGRNWPPGDKAGSYADTAYHASYPKERAWIEGYTDGFPTASPVGSFAPNESGIFDLGGNVWEWCEDAFHTSGLSRVLRGASWGDSDRGYMLSSYRIHFSPGARYYDYGFRCVIAASGAR